MPIDCLSHIYIILVNTTHAGNIGAAARAMKTMSLKKLRLVNPKLFPSAVATARAAGADDILNKADVFMDIPSAVSDCELVIAASSRKRNLSWPILTPRQAAQEVSQYRGKVAILFGKESSGLSNEEITYANYILTIPANSEYSSLNLAAAVQIICYELFMMCTNRSVYHPDKQTTFVKQREMEVFYKKFEECIARTSLYNRENPKLMMHRIKRLFNRAKLDKSEWKIMSGFLSKINEKMIKK